MMRTLLLSLLLASSASYSLNIPEPRLAAASTAVQISTPDHIGKAETYELVHFLLNGDIADINMNVNGNGGDINGIQELYNAIRTASESGKNITGTVTGLSISGHAMLLCAFDSITVKPGSSVVFHGFGRYADFMGLFTYRDQTPDMEYALFQERFLKDCVDKEILTKEDAADIQAGMKITYSYIDNQTRIRSVSADYTNNTLGQLLEVISKIFIAVAALLFIALAKRI